MCVLAKANARRLVKISLFIRMKATEDWCIKYCFASWCLSKCLPALQIRSSSGFWIHKSSRCPAVLTPPQDRRLKCGSHKGILKYFGATKAFSNVFVATKAFQMFCSHKGTTISHKGTTCSHKGTRFSHKGTRLATKAQGLATEAQCLPQRHQF